MTPYLLLRAFIAALYLVPILVCLWLVVNEIRKGP